MIKAVIFDMDGTLLNSLPDLKNSVNAAMEATGYPVHTMEEVRGFVGYGIPRLIRDALPDGAPEDVYEKACRVFYDHYVQHADNETHPYPGIVDMLHQLKEQGYVLGVLSNKAEEAVISLCERFFPGIFSVEAGARDDFPRKPESDQTALYSGRTGIEKRGSYLFRRFGCRCANGHPGRSKACCGGLGIPEQAVSGTGWRVSYSIFAGRTDSGNQNR